MEPAEQSLDRKVVLSILQHMKEMLGDQLAYHESSRNQYKSIVESLEKWGGRIFHLGFGMVLGRDLLQFGLSLFPLNEMYGMDMNSIVRSFLNMLAKLGTMWERVTQALEQEELPMEMFDILIKEFADLMLAEDTIGWQHQYMNLSVKPL